MIEITFVRHSEVELSYKGCYNGHIDIGLSSKGIEDAKQLSKRLAGSSFDMIFASDLKRVRETLEYLHREEAIVFTSQLREKSWGDDEGKSFEEIVASGRKYTTFLEWIEQLGGESIEMFYTRVERYFYNTILQSNAKKILVVSHAGVIKSIVGKCQGLGVEESFSIPMQYSDILHIKCEQIENATQITHL